MYKRDPYKAIVSDFQGKNPTYNILNHYKKSPLSFTRQNHKVYNFTVQKQKAK